MLPSNSRVVVQKPPLRTPPCIRSPEKTSTIEASAIVGFERLLKVLIVQSGSS